MYPVPGDLHTDINTQSNYPQLDFGVSLHQCQTKVLHLAQNQEQFIQNKSLHF